MTQSPEHDVIWLTQEAFDKLQDELENLRGPVREEIVARISAARDEGDLKENGGYHAAREEQGKTEARIRQLEDMLRKAQVGETPPDDGIVEPGMTVTVRFVGDTDEETSSSAPARWPTCTPSCRCTPRSPRWVRRSPASAVATRSTSWPRTARTSRSRSSTPYPSPADLSTGYSVTR